jgi:hypothetical protein
VKIPIEAWQMTDLQRQRRSSTHEERQVLALEMIADQLCLIAQELSGSRAGAAENHSEAKAPDTEHD